MDPLQAAPDTSALAWVPGVRGGQAPIHIQRLAGGSVNDSWRVDTALGSFVLRIDGPAWRRPGVDRQRESLLHLAAASAGLAPRLLLRAEGAGVQVCEYLQGRSWSEADFIQSSQLRRLGERLAQLHALAVPEGIDPFDPAACAREYLQAMDQQAAQDPYVQQTVGEIDAAAGQVAE